MADVLPLTARSPDYIVTPELDGVDLRIRARWLRRCAGWYLDLSTPAGDLIAAGVRVTPGAALAVPGAAEGLPPGRLVALGPDTYAYDSLGSMVHVLYLTAAEIAGA